MYHKQDSEILPADPPGSEEAPQVFATGCGVTVPDGSKPSEIAKWVMNPEGCSSVQETFAAQQAVEHLPTFAKDKANDLSVGVGAAILATDFGQDAAHRWALSEWNTATDDASLTPEQVRDVAIHMADIHSAGVENVLYWTSGVIAEFTFQNQFYPVGPLYAKSVKGFATGQHGWALNTQALATATFAKLGISEDTSVQLYMTQFGKNIKLWDECKKTAGTETPLIYLAGTGKPMTPTEIAVHLMQKTLELCPNFAGHASVPHFAEGYSLKNLARL